MGAGLWLVDCGGNVSDPVRHDVLDWLAGYDVTALTLTEACRETCDAALVRPCAVVGLIHSLEADHETLLNASSRLATVACVVLDASFDTSLGAHLLQAGVQDYLDVTRLDANELICRIDFAVIRSVPRELAFIGPALNDGEWQRVNNVYQRLPRRERQVLDLLMAERDQKQIARELGTEYTTVRTQTKSLRDKFGVQSTSQLVVLMVHTGYFRPNVS